MRLQNIKNWFILVLLPLLLGFLLYACFAPAGNWLETIQPGFKSPFPQFAFLSFYLPDGLWALAFVKSMLLIWWNEKRWMLLSAIGLAFVSGPIIELMQFSGKLHGTFDWMDLGVEMGFCCISLYKAYLKK